MNDCHLKRRLRLQRVLLNALILMLPVLAVAQPQTVHFALPTFSAYENSTNAIVVVTRTGGGGGVISVNYTTRDGSAVDVEDYIASSGTLTFASNDVVKTIPIAVVTNATQEFDEFFTVFLSDPVGATLGDQTNATVVIFDDDTDLFFSAAGFQIGEWETNAILTIHRAPVSQGAASVEVLIFNGTATNGVDFDFFATNVVFTNMQATAVLVIPMIDDCLIEPDETALVVLANPIGAKVGAQGTLTLTIESDDQGSGTLEFLQPGPVLANEALTPTVRVPVARQCTNGGGVTVNYRVMNSTNLPAFCHGTTNASPGIDYTGGTGTLSWAAGDGALKFIDIVIREDMDVELPESIWLELIDPPTGGAVLGTNRVFEIVILDDDLPAGAGDLFYNFATPENPSPGANNAVYAIAAYENPASPFNTGKVVIGGDFTAVNATVRGGVARLNADGTVDETFDSGSGADGFVGAVVILPDDRVLIAGGFGSVDNISRRGIARLNQDGSLDAGFNPGAGVDGPIFAMSLLQDGRLLIAGDFNNYNNEPRRGIARLNGDGSLDSTFDPGGGPDGPVYTMAQQADGSILIGGAFSFVDNSPFIGLARLNSFGVVDQSFAPIGGADGTVYALRIQNDGRILAGGGFSTYDGEPRQGIVRLNGTNGTLDVTFNPGTGVDGLVYTIDLEANGQALIGGDFSSFNGSARNNLARLYLNGTLDTTFMDNHYNNAAPGPNGFVASLKSLSDTNILIGGNFSSVGGGFLFFSVIPRDNYARILGGSTPTAGNAPGNFELSSAGYSVNENVLGGVLTVRVRRINGNLGSVIVPYFAVDGSARAGVDYSVAGSGFLTFNDCQTNDVNFPIVISDNNIVDGNRTFRIVLGQPQSIGPTVTNSPALGFITSADVTIIDNDFNRGTVGFAGGIYTVDESVPGGMATITVVRTNGSTGFVTVQYTTSNGSAVAGSDYDFKTDTLTFEPGTTTKTFQIRIRDDTATEFEETVNLTLFNVGGGATLGRTNAVLLINSGEVGRGSLSFATNEFTINEAAGTATIALRRTSGTAEKVFVDVLTLDRPPGIGAAREGVDYTGVTNTISFQAGETMQMVTVPIVADGLVEGTEYLNLILTNVTGGANLGYISTAALKIVDDDFYGSLSFSAVNFYVNEQESHAAITVERTGGGAEEVSVDFLLSAGSASEGVDYISTNGTLIFPAGSVFQTFHIPIQDDAQLEINETVMLILTNFAKASVGSMTQAMLSIIDDEALAAPAGSVDTFFNPVPGPNGFVNAIALLTDGRMFAAGDFTAFNGFVRRRIARLHTDGSVDSAFDPGGGANDNISAIAVQADEKVIVGGRFTRMGNRNRNGIARLNQNGVVDTAFNPGSGADNPVLAIAIDAEGDILIGGDFTTYNNSERSRVARLNPDGSLDMGFNPGNGANGAVQAFAIQPDGKIIVAGDFSEFDNQPANSIARLNANGSRDDTFQAAVGANGFIHTVALQADGKIVIGGAFTLVGGVSRNRIARLNADGTLDTGFDPGAGANDDVFALALQPDGRIVMAGEFTHVNNVNRNRLVRLNPDGSLDLSINFGSGANNFILAAVLQPDEQIVIGGGFTEVNAFPRRFIARLLGGSDSGPGVLEFSAAEYTITESGTNVAVQVVRTGGSTGALSVNVVSVDGTATAGQDYDAVNTTLFFNDGQTVATIQVPIRSDALVEPSENLSLLLTNLSGEGILGPQATATVTIVNDDARVGFSSPTYFVNENVVGGQATILIERTGTTNGTVTVNFVTRTNPPTTASAGADYAPINTSVVFQPGVTSQVVNIPIQEDSFVEGNESVSLLLSNLVGPAVLGTSSATLSIIDNDFNRGNLTFSSPQYTVSEGAPVASVTILRTNGNTGAISVDYHTTNGIATAGSDYEASSGRLTIGDGQVSGIINIPILDDFVIEGNETFLVVISNPTGGATISGPSSASVMIQENDFGPGSLDPAFDPGVGAGGLVRALAAQADGRLLVGGLFTTFGNTNRNFIARVYADGSHDLSFDPALGPNAGVFAMGVIPDGRIVIAGAFTNVNGAVYRRVARLLTNGLPDPNFNAVPNFNAAVNVLALQSDGRALVGGGFSEPIRSAAQLRLDGSVDTFFDLGLGANLPVHAALTLPGGQAYLGGAFTQVAGLDAARLVRLKSDGSVDSDFTVIAITSGTVYALARQADGKIVAAGEFMLNGASNVSHVARFNTDGSLDSSFNSDTSANGAVFAIAVQPSGKFLIGGDFTTFAGHFRNHYARLNSEGSVDMAFDPGNGADGTVYALLLLPDNNVLLGGDFHFVNGVPRRGIAKVRANDGQARFTGIYRTPTTTRLTLSVTPGANYILEMSPACGESAVWNAVQTNNATTGTLEFIHPINPGMNQMFYRARQADF